MRVCCTLLIAGIMAFCHGCRTTATAPDAQGSGVQAAASGATAAPQILCRAYCEMDESLVCLNTATGQTVSAAQHPAETRSLHHEYTRDLTPNGARPMTGEPCGEADVKKCEARLQQQYGNSCSHGRRTVQKIIHKGCETPVPDFTEPALKVSEHLYVVCFDSKRS